ncbi:MAG: PLP-dependent aminotransferase family protein [Opitutaceae bacterium]|nr:PLP-dependent aminotransferase family protein [Opitutaceae bacterium]
MTGSPLEFSSLGRRASSPTIARLMTAALENPGLLSLAAGFTDTASLPADAVARVTRELLDAAAPSLEMLQYGTNQGLGTLREQLAARLALLDGVVSYAAADVFVTNGSQQALYLAMQVLADPGDIVLVDQPSYFVFLEMLGGLGIRPRCLPVGVDGSLDLPGVDALLQTLEKSGEASRVKAVYLVSYFSNPSSRSLGREEKRGLGALFAKRGWKLPVLEDAAYRELYFDQPESTPSVFALSEWDGLPKLLLGTLTKPFATGLKVGFGLCSDREWLDKMLHVKGHHDFGTAHFNQAILERALAQGAYDRQLARVRDVYRAKRDALDSALREEELHKEGWKWHVPNGGLYLWLEGPAGCDTRMDGALFRRAVEAGVLYVPGDLCYGENPPRNFVRLSFGVLSPEQLGPAARRFSQAVAHQ